MIFSDDMPALETSSTCFFEDRKLNSLIRVENSSDEIKDVVKTLIKQ